MPHAPAPPGAGKLDTIDPVTRLYQYTYGVEPALTTKPLDIEYTWYPRGLDTGVGYDATNRHAYTNGTAIKLRQTAAAMAFFIIFTTLL